MKKFEEQRKILKTDFKMFQKIKTAAAKGEPMPPREKNVEEGERLIPLPSVNDACIREKGIYECLKKRRSVRKYSDDFLSMEELSYLLWASGGISGEGEETKLFKTAPSAGMTHTLETYLFIRKVEGLKEGLYRYHTSSHSLVLMKEMEDIAQTIDAFTMAKSQPFIPYFAGKSNVIFVWTSIPYRAEWKFDIQAHKKILIDVGHVCQNLYLASESIDSGCCAIGIYDQEELDAFLGLKPEEEMVIYLAAVGKKG